MNAIDSIKMKLAKYPGVSYSETLTSIEVRPGNDTGFTVSLYVHNNGATVHFDGWHETFDAEDDALNCFAFGLSEECRLQVVYRGSMPTRRVVESLRDGSWVPDTETGLILFPFWRRKRVVYRQNHLLPAAQQGAGADAQTARAPQR
jgi:hypothetical protein